MALVWGECKHRENWRRNGAKGHVLTSCVSVPMLWKEVSSSATHNGQWRGPCLEDLLWKKRKVKFFSHIVSQPNHSYLAGCGVPVTLSSLSADVPTLVLASAPLKQAPVRGREGVRLSVTTAQLLQQYG